MTPFFAFRVSRVQITTLYVKITCFALVIDFYTAFYRFQMLCALFPGPYKLPYIMAVIWDAKFKQNSHKSIIAEVQLKGNLVV